MVGQAVTHVLNDRRREASRLGTEFIALLERIGDPALTVMAAGAVVAKYWTAEMAECLRLANRVIDSSGGDVTADNLVAGSPVKGIYGITGTARWCLGLPGWKDDLRTSLALVRRADPAARGIGIYYVYVSAVPNGVLLSDATALRETADTLDILERHGDNFGLNMARSARAVVLAHQDGPSARRPSNCSQRCATRSSTTATAGWTCRTSIPTSPPRRPASATWTAPSRSLVGPRGPPRRGRIPFLRTGHHRAGRIPAGPRRRRRPTGSRGRIDRLVAAFPTDPGMTLVEVSSLRLRALLAQANGDEAGYREFGTVPEDGCRLRV